MSFYEWLTQKPHKGVINELREEMTQSGPGLPIDSNKHSDWINYLNLIKAESWVHRALNAAFMNYNSGY